MHRNYLQKISRKITEKLELSLFKSNRDAKIAPVFDSQVDFLLQLLQASADSDGDAKVIHSLLEANQEKLDMNFAQVLRSWTTATLLDLDPESAQNTVIDVFNFSYQLQDCSLGNRADNLEIAITGYEIALTIFTRDRFPEEWAIMQHNLGNAYLDCIQREKVENLEQAISCYQQTLQVYTRDRFPDEWATTQNNLGLTYFYRIQGEKAENLEQAISCYQKALQVYTCDRFPYEWATTKNNLGLTYFYRIQGEKAENLEQAISCYQKALQEYTREAFPQDHAETAFTQGLAYVDAKRFTDAYDIFKSAIDTVEFLRDEIVSGNEIKKEWNKLYRCMVEVCVELQYYDQVVEYIKRSNIPNLVELPIIQSSPELYQLQNINKEKHFLEAEVKYNLTEMLYQFQQPPQDLF
ncbi:tetratricopeptide repeat protein [Nostoc sp.]|uniref:tetratricopeptide repeat protein n=1 Tax=Nostoc sp. TaxID=1180 RepID=UPI00359357F5